MADSGATGSKGELEEQLLNVMTQYKLPTNTPDSWTELWTQAWRVAFKLAAFYPDTSAETVLELSGAYRMATAAGAPIGWMSMPVTRACTTCGAPADDYEWDEDTYWCRRHALLDTVGRECMGCQKVAESIEQVADWYIDNGGQLCTECEAKPR